MREYMHNDQAVVAAFNSGELFGWSTLTGRYHVGPLRELAEVGVVTVCRVSQEWLNLEVDGEEVKLVKP